MKLTVKGLPGKTVRLPLHPTHRDRGVREYCLREGSCLYISKRDIKLAAGDTVKLIGLPCVRVESATDEGVQASYLPGEHKKAGKIQCLQDYVECEVLRPDGGVDRGYCEPQCADLDVGTVVQFERYGFCRLDFKEAGRLRFVYGHM